MADVDTLRGTIELDDGPLRSASRRAGAQLENIERAAEQAGASIDDAADEAASSMRKIEGDADAASDSFIGIQTEAEQAADAIDASASTSERAVSKIDRAAEQAADEIQAMDRAAERASGSFGNMGRSASGSADAANKARAGFTNTKRALGALGIAAGAAATGIGVAGTKMFEWTRQASQQATQLGRLSRAVDENVGTIQRLATVYERAGSNQDQLRDNLFRLSERLHEARTETGGMRDDFLAAGFTMRELREDIDGPVDALTALSDKIQTSDSRVQALRASEAILGGEAQKLTTFLRSQDKTMRELMGSADEFGAIMGQDTVGDLRQMRKETRRVMADFERLKVDLVQDWGPSIIDTLEGVQQAMEAVSGTQVDDAVQESISDISAMPGDVSDAMRSTLSTTLAEEDFEQREAIIRQNPRIFGELAGDDQRRRQALTSGMPVQSRFSEMAIGEQLRAMERATTSSDISGRLPQHVEALRQLRRRWAEVVPDEQRAQKIMDRSLDDIQAAIENNMLDPRAIFGADLGAALQESAEDQQGQSGAEIDMGDGGGRRGQPSPDPMEPLAGITDRGFDVQARMREIQQAERDQFQETRRHEDFTRITPEDARRVAKIRDLQSDINEQRVRAAQLQGKERRRAKQKLEDMRTELEIARVRNKEGISDDERERRIAEIRSRRRAERARARQQRDTGEAEDRASEAEGRQRSVLEDTTTLVRAAGGFADQMARAADASERTQQGISAATSALSGGLGAAQQFASGNFAGGVAGILETAGSVVGSLVRRGQEDRRRSSIDRNRDENFATLLAERMADEFERRQVLQQDITLGPGRDRSSRQQARQDFDQMQREQRLREGG